jgi:hypothetical protein
MFGFKKAATNVAVKGGAITNGVMDVHQAFQDRGDLGNGGRLPIARVPLVKRFRLVQMFARQTGGWLIRGQYDTF